MLKSRYVEFVIAYTILFSDVITLFLRLFIDFLRITSRGIHDMMIYYIALCSFVHSDSAQHITGALYLFLQQNKIFIFVKINDMMIYINKALHHAGATLSTMSINAAYNCPSSLVV
jgi:hypothetical protein